MASRVEFVKRGSGNYTILYRNSSIELGEFLMGEDGYYQFWVSDMNFAEDMLKDISDKLIELNKEWDEQIKSDPNICNQIEF